MKFPDIGLFIIILFLLFISGCLVVQVPEGSPLSIAVPGNTPHPAQNGASASVSPEATMVSPSQDTAFNEQESREATPMPTTSVPEMPPETTPIQTMETQSDSQSQSTGTTENAVAQNATEESSSQIQEQSTQPEVVISYLTSDEINKHFMNIAFGTKRATIDRWTYDLPLQCSFTDLYLPEDFVTLDNFIKDFNALSQSTKISESIKKQAKGRLNIKFVPGNGLNEIDQEYIQEVYRDIDEGDTIVYMISYRNSNNEMFAYINNDLTDYERSHYLVRAMLYMLGFAGYTVDQPDSVFYVYSDTNTRLSIIDKEAIKVMYGNTIKPGMNQDQVRRVLMMK